MKIIISGCGRSGTRYMSELFQKMGLPCTHEVVFDPKNWRGSELPMLGMKNESAWESAPFLTQLDPDEYAILHIIRHPFKQINSLRNLGFFEVNDIWCQFACRIFPALNHGSYPERYAKYWIYWNKLVENVNYFGYVYQRFNIESILQVNPLYSFLKKAGIEVDKSIMMEALRVVPNNVNSVPYKIDKDTIKLSDIEDQDLKEKLLVQSEKYGYNLIEE